jgi:hypothetical protein
MSSSIQQMYQAYTHIAATSNKHLGGAVEQMSGLNACTGTSLRDWMFPNTCIQIAIAVAILPCLLQ